MKVLYIVKTQLHYYPPCISQIRMLKDLSYDVEVLYGTSNESALKLLSKENIPCHKVAEIKDVANSKIEKLQDWYKFRCGVLKTLKNYPEDTILWFGTAESALPMKGALNRKKYVLSLLELLDDCPRKVKLLKDLAQNATTVTVCEETRGYIMRAWWNLPEVPYVFPNKPYNQITDRRHEPSIPETKAVVERIKDKKVVLYQGILQNTDEILEVAKALRTMDSGYTLLLMGIDKYHSVEKIKAVYSDVEYVSYIPAPYHLEITSYAHIGIVFYRNDALNKVFCAPNKIYEYRFNYFYKKYKDIIQITENDNRIWILLFSIMIFENYNRGKFKRKLERIKVRSGRHTTVGIMQVGSDADLTDEESINLAYFKLKDEIVRGNIVTDDEGEINHYAFQYNPDEDYARSITYIYQRLCGYLKSTQRFYIAFHLEEHPEEESPVDPLDEAMMSFGEPKSYLTFDDVRILTGLSKKELKKKLKEKQIVAMYDEDAVRQAFDEDIAKG